MGLTLTAAARYLMGTSAWEVLDAPSRAANYLDEFVASASKSPASGAVGVLVEDSDYAYIVFAANGGRPGRVLIGPESARDYKQGRTALERLNDQRDRPSSLFVDWARTLGFIGPSSPSGRMPTSVVAAGPHRAPHGPLFTPCQIAGRRMVAPSREELDP
jgi:hypothetical protein